MRPVALPRPRAKVSAEPAPLDKRNRPLAHEQRLFVEAVAHESFVDEPVRRHPDRPSPVAVRAVRFLPARNRAYAVRPPKCFFIQKFVVNERSRFFLRVQVGEQRSEMGPGSDPERLVFGHRYRRPIPTVGKKTLAHRGAYEVNVELAKKLVLLLSPKRSPVFKRTQVLHENRVERDVLYPKMAVHAKLGVKIASAIRVHELQTARKMVCRRYVVRHMKDAVKAR